MSTYSVVSGVPKPKNLANRPSGEVKYPLRQMAVGDFFLVPRKDFFPEGVEFDPELFDAKKFRNRIQQGVRNTTLNMNKENEAKEGFDAETYVPIRFTVASIDEAILEHLRQNGYPDAQTGDVGVWRDQ